MRGFAAKVLLVCKSRRPSSEGQQSMEAHKSLPDRAYCNHNIECTSMAEEPGSTDLGDCSPSEWLEVSDSTINLLGFILMV